MFDRTGVDSDTEAGVLKLAVLELCNVSTWIGRTHVLKDISLRVYPGELVGIIGPNGSGKSTLIKTSIGERPASTGSIHIGGRDIRTERVRAAAHFGCAVDPEDLPEQLTGLQAVKLVASAKRLSNYADELRSLIDLLELQPFIGAEIGTYSKGTRQKLSLVMALLGKPPLIFLDESLSNLDPVSVFQMKTYLSELVRDGEVGIMLASHAIEAVEKICTRVAVLVNGQLEAVLSKEQLDAHREQSGKGLEEVFIDLIGSSNQALRG